MVATLDLCEPIELTEENISLTVDAMRQYRDMRSFREWIEPYFYLHFKPRPNRPEKFDEQQAFVESRDTVSWLIGGNACLRESTLIDDPWGGRPRAIGDLSGTFAVASFDGTCARVGQAAAAWRKPRRAEMVRIVLSTGEELVGSRDHLVLGAVQGGNDPRHPALAWLRLADVLPGTFLVHAPSRVVLPQRASGCRWSWPHDPRCSGRPEGSPGHCSADCRRCDGCVLPPSGIALEQLPQRADARGHSPVSQPADDPCGATGCTRLCRSSGRLSISASRHRIGVPRAWCIPGVGGRIERHPAARGTLCPGEVARAYSASGALAESERSHTVSCPHCAIEASGHSAKGRRCVCEPCGPPTGLGITQVTAHETTSQEWVWTCHVPGLNNYAAQGLYHHNSGTTEASAFKLAQFVLHQQEAPRKDCPFWIISNTYDQVCGTIWLEKLIGHGHIPYTEIDWDRIRWMSAAAQWPFSVPLLPWRNGNPKHNWCLEFKSFEQGRRAMQARSIGGFFFSEQFPSDIFLEILRGCREYMYPGGQFCEFTPIEADLCMWVERLMETPPRGWGFYRANTEENKSNLADGWFENFFAAVPEELLQTRLTGALATYEGVIFESFSQKLHVVGDEVIDPKREGLFHHRGFDWGASREHPFACIWGAVDGMGTWYIYDEYWSPSQGLTGLDHIKEVKRRWAWPEQSPFHLTSYGDPSRPDMFNLFNAFGIDVHRGLNDVHKGIDTIRTLLQPQEDGTPRIFIHKRCEHLIQELRKYRWMRGRQPGHGNYLNPKTAKTIPLKRDDDTVDAMRYMIHSASTLRGMGIDSMRYRDEDHVHRAVRLSLGESGRPAFSNLPRDLSVPGARLRDTQNEGGEDVRSY